MILDGSKSRTELTGRQTVQPTLSARFSVLAFSAGLVGLIGCRATLKPVFESIANAPVWPATPAQTRIRYVGQLSTAADLKPAPKAWGVFRDMLAGPEKPDELLGPRSVVCTRGGQRVWICDPGGRCVHVFDLNDRRSSKITSVGQSKLLAPTDICAGPPGTLYLCDTEANSIYKINERDGSLIESIQTEPDLLRAVALDWSPQTAELFVVDIGAHDVKVLNENGRTLRVIGRRGVEAGEFNYPSDVLLDRDRLWVVDSGNRRVQGLSLIGEAPIILGKAGDAPGDLALPKSIAADSDGHLYVVDARFENVQVFDRAGRLLLYWGGEGNGPGEFWLPGGIYIDVRDRIWVCDPYNKRIQVFDYVKPQSKPRRSSIDLDASNHKPKRE